MGLLYLHSSRLSSMASLLLLFLPQSQPPVVEGFRLLPSNFPPVSTSHRPLCPEAAPLPRFHALSLHATKGDALTVNTPPTPSQGTRDLLHIGEGDGCLRTSPNTVSLNLVGDGQREWPSPLTASLGTPELFEFLQDPKKNALWLQRHGEPQLVEGQEEEENSSLLSRSRLVSFLDRLASLGPTGSFPSVRGPLRLDEVEGRLRSALMMLGDGDSGGGRGLMSEWDEEAAEALVRDITSSCVFLSEVGKAAGLQRDGKDLVDPSGVVLNFYSVTKQMCPLWHVDKTTFRLLMTLKGPGTEWVDERDIERSPSSGDFRVHLSEGDRERDTGPHNLRPISLLPSSSASSSPSFDFRTLMASSFGGLSLPSHLPVEGVPELSVQEGLDERADPKRKGPKRKRPYATGLLDGLLLKGAAVPGLERRAAVHRSPEVVLGEAGETVPSPRILLAVDLQSLEEETD
uniref:Fe2OG dioxygenase domain-containing protein n=1 Tax=Chromera velia CCMP2878 TaxID=1169474 RepID=A0A0G4FC43_9ALVE|mmetsp:Transcript_32244/g.63993  ORF Transcript_32244/g.63993 Transcript_32244/m.63993 type:complete len:459 (+) Transcript_32244:198-1574(+)|eukprot:Cvel_16132.t1-p1 / transcript=Cvel_16132.t1 / gene=Cvel_16132 / organism=Chromera_velia_CCMP2878 / gene_product=hypothetical protein / transcript_product=hypothetical protein / location=Cvel_scaffold1227:45992-49044(-) / protein_length=458 / sequence_SO=supercontig / SO=protein_coding / is_pseudo=false